MTGFFEQQERARRATRVLLALMVTAVFAMAFAIYVALQALASVGRGPMLLRPGLFVGALIGTGLMVLLASGVRMFALRGGGGQIAEMLGGRLISGSPRDALETRLLNVVEEMAIASGVPVPQVFVLEGETGINALAAGLTLNDAAVAVTRGCLEQLTREELQGVIAHEFSHVLNGDMRLNIRLMGILFGIVCIGLMGRILMRAGSVSRWDDRERRGSGAPVLMFGLAVMVIGAIGEFFGKLIKAAVSRQREYLADASAVQFTRNPQGIAGALKKIGGLSQGGRVAIQRAEEASHFFFADIHSGFFALPWFATHPPLDDRIARLDPSFVQPLPSGAAGPATQPDAAQLPGVMGLSAPGIVARVGAPDAASMACAKQLRERIPADLRATIAVPFSACAAVYALLLSERAHVQASQRSKLETLAGAGAWHETERLARDVHALPRSERLPFVELLAPALRELSREQRVVFSDTVAQLIDADDAVSIFEYVLSHTLADRLSDPAQRPRAGARHRSFRSVHDELALLLSLLAHAGAYEPHAAQPAFALGVSRLMGVELALLQGSPRLLSGLSNALDELRALVPELSQQVVDACAHIVIADRRVSEDEFTLLRAVCAALDCPLPPVSGLTSSRPPPPEPA